MSDDGPGTRRQPSPPGHVAPGYEISLFAEQERFTGEDLIGLWTGESRIGEDEARRRVDEVLLVAGAPDGSLAGISTAFIESDPLLGLNVWNYRTLVAEAHRDTNLAAAMAVRSRDHLEGLYTSGADTRAAGVISEVHSPVLKRLDLAVWRQTGFTFLGEDTKGSHIRIHYFPGAPAPPPPQER
jgi:hypothetical protein